MGKAGKRKKHGGAPPHVIRARERSARTAQESANKEKSAQASGCRGVCKSPKFAARSPHPGEKGYYTKGFVYCRRCKSYMIDRQPACPCVPAHEIQGRSKAKKYAERRQAFEANVAARRKRHGGTRIEGAVTIKDRRGKIRSRQEVVHGNYTPYQGV